MQLDGTLDKFPLRELIEMVTYSSVTGVLEIRMGMEIGQIFFDDGRPYHAVAGSLTGIDATTAMFESHDAPFRFVADQEIGESTLWQDAWEIIEHSEEQASKWLVVRERIPSMDCVPALRDSPAIGQVQISDTVWPVLAAIDGQRTVREMADYLNLVLLDCCLGLMIVMERGLITLQPPRPPIVEPTLDHLPALVTPEPAPESTASGDAADPSAGNGFLERLLAEAQAQEQQRPDLTDDETQDRKRVYRYVDDRR